MKNENPSWWLIKIRRLSDIGTKNEGHKFSLYNLFLWNGQVRIQVRLGSNLTFFPGSVNLYGFSRSNLIISCKTHQFFQVTTWVLTWHHFSGCRLNGRLWTILESKSAVHVLLSRFYPDFIQILSRFYPNFILILSRFCPDF